MLVKDIDALIVAQQEKKLAAVVNFVGEPKDELKEKIKKFGDKQALKKVGLAVTKDTGPLKISDGAEVSVMIYHRKKVKFNYALAKDGLDEKTVAAIVGDVKKMLKELPEEPKAKPKDKAKPKEKPSKEQPSKEKPKPKPKKKEGPKSEAKKDCP
jgi:hypothetical protein